jgi:DNA-directed RNA polymerase subunit RPC12/RpoP
MLNLMQVIRQYLCSTCGSVLKETSEYIEIHSLREECPSCGSMLSESLIRRSLRPEAEISAPKIQTADTLLLKKLRFDIPSLDLPLRIYVAYPATAQTCCLQDCA